MLTVLCPESHTMTNRSTSAPASRPSMPLLKSHRLLHRSWTSQKNHPHHLAWTLRLPPSTCKSCKPHAPLASIPHMPLTTCLMMRLHISAARHSILYGQRMTLVTESTINGLTQEGQFLKHPGGVTTGYMLGLQMPKSGHLRSCHRHDVRATPIQCWFGMSCPNLAVCRVDSLVPSCSRYERSGSHTRVTS